MLAYLSVQEGECINYKPHSAQQPQRKHRTHISINTTKHSNHKSKHMNRQEKPE